MTAAAVEAINGLTAATETANVLEKTVGGLMDGIAKSLASIVNLFIQPLAPLMTWLMAQIVFGLMGFKAWWDNLPKWFDENVFKPIRQWIDKYIVQPFWEFFNKVQTWINEHIVKPFWEFFENVSSWINQYIVQPFWYWFNNISSWVDEKLVKPFWKFFSDIGTLFEDNISKPFLKAIKDIDNWITEHIRKPFDKMFGDINTWINVHIRNPFNYALAEVSGWIERYITYPFNNFVNNIGSLFNNVINQISNWLNNLPGVSQVRAVSNYFSGYSEPTRSWEMGGTPYNEWLEGGLPYIGTWAKGGKIPGRGAKLATVHGGEEITPAGGSKITLNFYGYQDDKFIQKVKDVMRSQGTAYNL